MTKLIRARGALSEMTTLFAAEADSDITWSDPIWPGETALVVTAIDDDADSESQRRLTAMRWGLPALTFVQPVPAKQRTGIFTRDLVLGGRLATPDRLRRCA